MLQTVAVASLIAASSWVVVPSPRTICMQSASFACQRAMTIQMEEDTPAPPPAESEERMADFTEDLLDALAADDDVGVLALARRRAGHVGAHRSVMPFHPSAPSPLSRRCRCSTAA